MKKICLLSAVLTLIIVAEARGTHLPPVDLAHMKKVVSLDTPPATIYFDDKTLNYYMEYERFDEESQKTIKDIVAFVPKNKIVPAVNINVSRLPTGEYQYAYLFSNGSTAVQGIYKALIRELTNVGNIAVPVGWSKAERSISWRFTGWRNFQYPPKPDEITPGQSKSGFVIEDIRLPGIRAIYFAGSPSIEERGISQAFHGEPTKSVSQALDLVDNDSTNYVIRKTIAPYFTPIDTRSILCDTFILDLIGQVREAAALGWIKHDLRKDDDERGKKKGDEKGMKKGQPSFAKASEGEDDGDDHADDDVEMDKKDNLSSEALAKEEGMPGVAKSIIKKLTKVRRECMRGKFGNAREKLRALIKQVNAQRGKHLTEEAYALIRFNAEFLLEKI